MSETNIFGFTLLRNGIKYDYCFLECLESLSKVSQKIYLALGKSEDGTEEKVNSLDYIKAIPTVWDDSLREGGLILSQQTNVALNSLRDEKRSLPGAWGIYLQCDEVFHENDYELIKEDIKKAEQSGCDVMAFRYFHFWQSHHDIAINKKWYPQEIRAVKLDTDIESWGDAQSFKNYKKVYYSEARIFHYGHVREEESYKTKKADILKLYHLDEKLSKYKKREKKFDNQTETLAYWASHPEVMRARIENLGERWLPEKKELVYIVGNPMSFSKRMRESIFSNEVIWVNSWFEIPSEYRSEAIHSEIGFFNNLLSSSRVPKKMRSKLALDWSNDFILMLKLSEKKIGSNY